MEEGVKMDWISVNSGWGTMTKKSYTLEDTYVVDQDHQMRASEKYFWYISSRKKSRDGEKWRLGLKSK